MLVSLPFYHISAAVVLSNLVLQALPSTLNEGLALREIMRVVHQNQGPYFPEIYKEQRQLNPVAPSHVAQQD